MVSNARTSVAAPKSRTSSSVKTKKRKFVIGGAIVLLAIAYLMYTNMQEATIYYLTPTELLKRVETVSEQGVRVGGIAVEGTVKFDNTTRTLSFKVGDEQTQIPVVYKGVIPDTFKEGVDVVIEGKYTSEGIFEATTLLAKCPSKYVPEV